MEKTTVIDEVYAPPIMNLQQFWQYYQGKVASCLTVRGDCMEGFGRNEGLPGICDGDIVRVHFGKMPLPPKFRKHDGYDHEDACLCYGSMHGGPPQMMIKAYGGVWGWMQQVGTCYAQKPGAAFRMNYAFEPKAVLGVVSACYSPSGVLKWERDISEYPEELGAENTMRRLTPINVMAIEK